MMKQGKIVLIFNHISLKFAASVKVLNFRA